MAHSSNLIIGSTFNSAQGDFHIHNGHSESGLRELKLGVSLGAIHDSAERYPPPKCHPDTRKAVKRIILDWIHSESSTSFFWLYGPAGAGKTAILQAIAEFLCSPSGTGHNFGGSFFFSRGKKGRDQGFFLFSTIAYQLALKVPGLRQHVNRIMELNPTLHTKSMDVQLQTLIVDAFQYLSPLPQHSYLVIIDGLDECHDKADQQSILRLLCETITVHKLPLRFLIGSRPESHIRDSFDKESLYTITRRVVLDETFDPRRDIRVFLQDGFANICAKNPILSHVKQPWPEEGIIDLLVQRSSGQFIYAATVLKFVGADFCSPTKQLVLVLKPDPSAFSDLDQLYTQILSVYPSSVNIVQVLGTISVLEFDGNSEMVEDILGMEEGELKLILRGLSSLMDLEDGNDENKECYAIPQFAHASFSDYLFDSSRSGPFHVNRQVYENKVTIRSFAFITQSIRSTSSRVTRDQVLHSKTWGYFTSRLALRFFLSPKQVKESIVADINDLVEEFWRTPSASDGVFGASFFEMRCLFNILQGCFNQLEMSVSWKGQYSAQSDERIRAEFKILRDGYRKMFDQSLSKSKDLGDMLKFLPGVVVQDHMSMQGMTDLYGIKPDLLERLIKSIAGMINVTPFSRYKLDHYLSGFLQERDRSQLYYCDPMLQHISICRRFLSLLDRSDSLDLQSYDLSNYVILHFYDHLCAAVFLNEQNIAADRLIEILHDLETTTYHVDENLSDYILKLAEYIIQAILRWVNMLNYRLKDVAVSVSYVDLMERVCHLTTKIYREILCITSLHGERIMNITMGGLNRLRLCAFSWTPQDSIVLSWDLLVWISVKGRIPCSFTNFITSPELSGHLYISPDTYHTQITECLLEEIYRLSPNYRLSPSHLHDCSLNPDWAFREHLSRALPTERIFYLLRSIRSKCLIRNYSAKLMRDTLEVIIKWLQGLDSERPNDLYDRFQNELLQHKKAFPQL